MESRLHSLGMIGTDFDRHTSAGAHGCQSTRLAVHTISVTNLQQGIRPAEHSQLTASKIDGQQNTHPISIERIEFEAHRDRSSIGQTSKPTVNSQVVSIG